MAPVAKRNFCRRHDHGMSGEKVGDLDGDDDDEGDEEDMDESERTGDVEPTTKPKPSLETATNQVKRKHL